jgi:hypothetical protein
MLDAWNTPLDLYCERTGPEFWSEPVNALTNLAFVLAGLWGVWAARRYRAGTFAEVLGWWAVAIGIGSGLFHTFANRVTMWADILPIVFFTLTYTVFLLRRYLGFSRASTTVVFVAFFAVAGFLTWLVPEWLREATNGSTGYLPAFLALFVFGGWVAATGHPAGRWLVAASLVFVASVTFRAIDNHACESFALGTHFMWHLLNGLMIGLLLVAAARYGGNRAGRATP